MPVTCIRRLYLGYGSGGWVVRHCHHKPYPVQSEYVARMVNSKRRSVPGQYMIVSSPMRSEKIFGQSD
ncbi:UNVERIFIED_CONTAM: hypothetical protein Sradi_2379600 [Sesamum radiatum]|uniref:Uncharacterized protein n=1 Tax=Sesamum radiatum TaxID=300843 RepID=A0AAW2T6I2_SESRA